MNEIIFELLKLAIMIACLFVTTYLIPWIKEKLGAEKVAQIAMWAKQAVLMAEQFYSGYKGPDKKAFVVEYLKKILVSKNIALTDEQLDILIEAAVKQMKIDEGASDQKKLL